MWEWLLEVAGQSIAATVFFSIFLAGLVFVLGSFVLGSFGAEHDHDHDHDAAGGDHDHDDDHGEGPSMLSVRGVALFATGFGGVSFLAHTSTRNVTVSSLIGLASGWVFAFAVLWVMRLLMQQQASSLLQPQEYRGAAGVVLTSIPANAYGEVRLAVGGQELVKMAAAAGGQAIPVGTRVEVVENYGGHVLVRPRG